MRGPVSKDPRMTRPIPLYPLDIFTPDIIRALDQE